MSINELTKISLFEGNQIRRIFLENDWWFSVTDIIAFLTDSKKPRDYWHKMKSREKSSADIELSTICRQFKLMAPDGKKRETDCANTEGVFRIIQSIPSPKAEPFKVWLAKIGKERIDEIENPELGIQRVKGLYEKKGYKKAWIDKRFQSMATRNNLTDEWRDRGAQKPVDFALLTNDIMQGAFSLKVNDYKQLKGLERESLRDHMTDLELIITMLGEATTTQLTQQKDSKGMPSLRGDAQTGGAVAGRARRDIERQVGKRVVSENNFLLNRAKLSKVAEI
jgi:hypothetical protein